jgi:hypothetical protein
MISNSYSCCAIYSGIYQHIGCQLLRLGEELESDKNRNSEAKRNNCSAMHLTNIKQAFTCVG